MKRLFILFVMALCCTSLSAQQRQTDVMDYNKATGYGNIKMPGKITRSWYLGDDGKKVFDGPMSVSCKLNNTNVSVWPYDFTLSGTYTSNFSLAHGKLNGAGTSSYRLNVVKQGRNPETKSEYYTFSGSFLKGVPNGAFKMDCNGELKLTATYKNGVLVGSFYYEEVLKQHKITGTLTQEGKPTGQWVYKSDAHITRTMQMQNGVLLSERYVDTSNIRPMDTTTDAATTAAAKSYATGSISEGELYAKGYIVLEEEFMLGEKAAIALDEYSGFMGFTNSEFYEFSGPKSVSFKLLNKVNILNEEGIKRVTEDIIASDISSDKSVFKKISYDGSNEEEESNYTSILRSTDGGNGEYYYHSKVRVLGNGVAYVHFYKLDDSLLSVKNSDDTFAYMPAEAFLGLQQALHESRVARARDYAEYIGCDTNIDAYASMTAKELEYEIENIKRQISQKVNLHPHPEYAEFMVSDENIKSHLSYFTKSSYDAVLQLITELEVLLEKTKAKEAERALVEKQEAERRAAEEAELAKREPIEKCLKFFVENKSASGISYDSNVTQYVKPGKLPADYWQLEFGKLLKPFCPIIGYEIVSITEKSNDYNFSREYEVVCRIHKQGKKKMTEKYELTLTFIDSKVVATSFNFDQAKLVE